MSKARSLDTDLIFGSDSKPVHTYNKLALTIEKVSKMSVPPYFQKSVTQNIKFAPCKIGRLREGVVDNFNFLKQDLAFTAGCRIDWWVVGACSWLQASKISYWDGYSNILRICCSIPPSDFHLSQFEHFLLHNFIISSAFMLKPNEFPLISPIILQFFSLKECFPTSNFFKIWGNSPP